MQLALVTWAMTWKLLRYKWTFICSYHSFWFLKINFNCLGIFALLMMDEGDTAVPLNSLWVLQTSSHYSTHLFHLLLLCNPIWLFQQSQAVPVTIPGTHVSQGFFTCVSQRKATILRAWNSLNTRCSEHKWHVERNFKEEK